MTLTTFILSVLVFLPITAVLGSIVKDILEDRKLGAFEFTFVGLSAVLLAVLLNI